jgi:hypothetical protein
MMKPSQPNAPRQNGFRFWRKRRQSRERGLVAVIVLILIVLVGLYVQSNTRVLSALRQEIQSIERSRVLSERVEPGTSP